MVVCFYYEFRAVSVSFGVICHFFRLTFATIANCICNINETHVIGVVLVLSVYLLRRIVAQSFVPTCGEFDVYESVHIYAPHTNSFTGWQWDWMWIGFTISFRIGTAKLCEKCNILFMKKNWWLISREKPPHINTLTVLYSRPMICCSLFISIFPKKYISKQKYTVSIIFGHIDSIFFQFYCLFFDCNSIKIELTVYRWDLNGSMLWILIKKKKKLQFRWVGVYIENRQHRQHLISSMQNDEHFIYILGFLGLKFAYACLLFVQKFVHYFRLHAVVPSKIGFSVKIFSEFYFI